MIPVLLQQRAGIAFRRGVSIDKFQPGSGLKSVQQRPGGSESSVAPEERVALGDHQVGDDYVPEPPQDPWPGRRCSRVVGIVAGEEGDPTSRVNENPGAGGPANRWPG